MPYAQLGEEGLTTCRGVADITAKTQNDSSEQDLPGESDFFRGDRNCQLVSDSTARSMR